jgi:hypothetical protein
MQAAFDLLLFGKKSQDLSDPDRRYGEQQPMVGDPALAMPKGIHSSLTDAGSNGAFPQTAKGAFK